MDFLEKDLEEIIYQTPSEILNQRGLEFRGLRLRQLRIGNYGISDLITIERDYQGCKTHLVHITVYELKKDKIGISAFLQAIQYAIGIKSYLEKINSSVSANINIVLIGKDIDSSGAFCYLPCLINNSYETIPYETSLFSIRYYTYKYKIDGLHFKEHSGYRLIDEGFKL